MLVSSDYDVARALADAVGYTSPIILGTVYAVRKVDSDQPRNPELTRVVGLLFLAMALYMPAVQDWMNEFVQARWDLAAFNVFLVRCIVLLAAGEYVALAGRLAGSRLLVEFGRPYAAIVLLVLLSAYCFTPVRTDGVSNARVFDLVYGAAAVVASGAVLVVATWARRHATSPAIRRSLAALGLASLLGVAYGALTIEYGTDAFVQIVAGASLGALAIAGALAFLRRQRLRQLGD